MGVFAPWALLRLIPLAELASSAASSLRSEARTPMAELGRGWAVGDQGESWIATTTAMRRDSERGLATGSDPNGRVNGAGPAAAESRNGRTSSDDSISEDPTADYLPTPQPDEPDLAPVGTRASARPGDPAAQPDAQPTGRRERGAGTQAGAGPSERLPGLPDMWQHDDLSWDPVILGPEGVVGPKARPQDRTPSSTEPTRPGPSSPSQPPSDEPDPTPPPQAPPDGRL
jgi:hypothetical protein